MLDLSKIFGHTYAHGFVEGDKREGELARVAVRRADNTNVYNIWMVEEQAFELCWRDFPDIVTYVSTRRPSAYIVRVTQTLKTAHFDEFLRRSA